MKQSTVFERLKQGELVGDEEFNAIYPEYIKELSAKHWTLVAVAKAAAGFLVTNPGTKVLDIGSGVGKFCMIGSIVTSGHFAGVEYRENLSNLSKRISQQQGLTHVKFINANITNVSFKEFNAFYFFNPFIENMSQSEVIDDTVPIGKQHYGQYTQYVRMQLAIMPIGTRLATYWSNSEEVPRGYVLQSSNFEGELKLWEKLF